MLSANICIDSRIQTNIPGVICKLDLEKPYNLVNCGYLNCVGPLQFWSVMEGINVGMIQFHFVVVLVNGSLMGYVGCSKGLRQVDPLSPLLFLLVANVFWKE